MYLKLRCNNLHQSKINYSNLDKSKFPLSGPLSKKINANITMNMQILFATNTICSLPGVIVFSIPQNKMNMHVIMSTQN
jgi:ABC-type glycerol-3-phosphate transport system permease component